MFTYLDFNKALLFLRATDTTEHVEKLPEDFYLCGGGYSLRGQLEETANLALWIVATAVRRWVPEATLSETKHNGHECWLANKTHQYGIGGQGMPHVWIVPRSPTSGDSGRTEFLESYGEQLRLLIRIAEKHIVVPVQKMDLTRNTPVA